MTRFQLAILLIGLQLERYRLKACIAVSTLKHWWLCNRLRRMQKKIRRDMQKFVDEN